MNVPILKLNDWLEKERKLGSSNPDRAVLATAGKDNIPHSRVVAIREINEKGILFFTQRGTRKVMELQQNPYASMTLWLPLQQREIIVEGGVIELSREVNEKYWKTLPRDRQLRFAAYAPTSTQPIQSIETINDEYHNLLKQFDRRDVPISEYYCGFRLFPEYFYFYSLGSDDFSELIKYRFNNDQWTEQLLSP